MPPCDTPSTKKAQELTAGAVASTVIGASKFFAIPSVAEVGLIGPTEKVPTAPPSVVKVSTLLNAFLTPEFVFSPIMQNE